MSSVNSYSCFFFFFSSRRRHTRYWRDWSSDVCSSDLWTPRSLLRTDILDRGIPWAELLWRARAFTADLNLQTSNRISVICVYLLWAALPASILEPLLLGAALALALALLGFNASLYAFFLRKRGPFFLVGVLPWHWLYYTYNGVCFALGTLAYLRRRSCPARVWRAGE